jgi:hypothetical protein
MSQDEDMTQDESNKMTCIFPNFGFSVLVSARCIVST